jgi:hypothetical protein
MLPISFTAFIETIGSTQGLPGTVTTGGLRNVGKKLAASPTLKKSRGPAEEIVEGVFKQDKRPFADAVVKYKGWRGTSPNSIKELAEFTDSLGGVWFGALYGVRET